MTGVHCAGTQSNVVYWDTPWGVSLNETFLPQNLQDANYETAIFGKWHLGMFKEAYTRAARIRTTWATTRMRVRLDACRRVLWCWLAGESELHMRPAMGLEGLPWL